MPDLAAALDLVNYGFDPKQDRAVLRAISEVDLAVDHAIATRHAKWSYNEWFSQRFSWIDDDDLDRPQRALKPDTYASVGYGTHAWTYGAVRAIVSAGSRCPWGIRRKQDGKPLEGHDAQDIIEYANPVQNDVRLFGTTLLNNELWGSAYLDMEMQGKKLKALWPVPPLPMRVSKMVKGEPAEYTFRNDDGTERVFQADQVVWFHFEGPGHWLSTQASMSAAQQAIQTDLNSLRMQALFFERGHHSFALSTDQQLGQERVDELRRQWAENYKGLDQMYKPPVLHSGLKPAEIGKGPGTEIMQLREQLRQDVLMVFQVYPAVLGIFDNAQFGVSVREQQRMFWQNCLQPRLDAIAADITDQLIIRIDDGAEFYWKYDEIEALKPDWSMMLGPLNSAVGGPFLWVDEAREIVGKEPLPNGAGEVLYETMAMMPTGPGAMAHAEESPDSGGSTAPPEAPTVGPDEESEEEPVVEEDQELSGGWRITKGYRRLSREARLERWRSLNAERIRQQRILTELLAPVFDDLAAAVIANLNAQKSALQPGRMKDPRLESLLFDVAVAEAAYEDVILPFLTDLATRIGQEAAQMAKPGIAFDIGTERMQEALVGRTRFMRSIAESSQGTLRTSLAEGLAQGEATTKLTERALQWAAHGKEQYAQHVARTETGTVMNAAADEGWKQGGATGREWLCIVDDRTRGADPKDVTDHLSHDGEVLPYGTPFLLEGPMGLEACEFPMDPNLSAANIISCRCTTAPVFEESES